MATSHEKALGKKLKVENKSSAKEEARFATSKTVKNGVARFGRNPHI